MKVGVYGGSGYAGQDAVEILAKHPCVELVFATSSTYAGQRVPFTDLRYVQPDDVPLSSDAVDAVFLALPHGVSAKMAARALDVGVRVIDLSADLRLDTPESYKQWYGHTHPHPDLLASTPYGLPEFNRDQLRGAPAGRRPRLLPDHDAARPVSTPQGRLDCPRSTHHR